LQIDRSRSASNGMRQTTKRFLSLILGLAFLVGALVVFFEFIQPAYEDAQGIKAQGLGLRSFLASESATIKQVKDLISAYQGQGEVQQAVSLALPLKEDVAGAVAQLYGLAQNNNLILGSISVSVGLAAPSSRAAAGGEQAAAEFTLQKPIGSVNFQLKLTGPYEALKAFMSKLENNLRVFDLKSLAITQSAGVSGKGAQDIYNYDVGVTAYYQGQ